ncbi:MAG: ABC transporter permease [Candidatus Aenigmarchaeota archaeon]|nr:ABC transporter permease [Candidatus Aenigmarchaeota archaeon]
MILGDIYTIWLREMIRFVRAKSRIVSSLALPFFWLAFIGVGFGSTVKLPSISYIDFLAPGILGMIILFTSIFSGLSILFDRQFGFMKEILVAPVSRTSIMLGKTLGGATIALINALLMLVIASAIGVIKIGPGIFTAIIFMILTAICFVSVGMIIASKMKSMEGFQMIMSFLIMPVFFLSGALFPLQNTPGWMQTISYFDPLTYGVDGLRDSLIGNGMFPLWMNLSVLVGFSAVLIILGSYFFSKMSV